MEIKLYNGINVTFGRDKLDERVNLFIDIARNVISQQPDDIESLDMRYDSGFTIVWKNLLQIANIKKDISEQEKRKESHRWIGYWNIKVVAIVGEINESNQIEVVGIGMHPSRGLKKVWLLILNLRSILSKKQ